MSISIKGTNIISITANDFDGWKFFAHDFVVKKSNDGSILASLDLSKNVDDLNVLRERKHSIIKLWYPFKIPKSKYAQKHSSITLTLLFPEPEKYICDVNIDDSQAVFEIIKHVTN